MRLLTKTIVSRLPPLYATDSVPFEEKVAQVKFFGPGRLTWYAVEYDAQKGLFFGYVQGPVEGGNEWGYFRLQDLERLKVPVHLHVIERSEPVAPCLIPGVVVERGGAEHNHTMRCPVERDLHFHPAPMRDVLPRIFGKRAAPLGQLSIPEIFT